MKATSGDARVIVGDRDASARTSDFPMMLVRTSRPVERFASSYGASGRQDRVNNVAHPKGNLSLMTKSASKRPREAYGAIEVDDDDDNEMSRPIKQSRRQLVIDDDDNDEETKEEALVIQAREPPPSDGDKTEDDEIRQQDGSVRDHAVAERTRFLRDAMWSDDDTSDDDGKPRDHDTEEEFRPKPQSEKILPSLDAVNDDEADARLMRAAIDHKTRIVTKRRGMPWDAIALKLNDTRLPTGVDVKKRVDELLKQLKASSRRGRAKGGTPASLLPLLIEYKALVARWHEGAYSGPTGRTSVGVNQQAATDPKTPRRGVRAASVKAASDQFLLQLVLEHRAGLVVNATVMKTWQVVADALSPKYPQFKSGLTAKSKFESLLKAHEDTTPVENINSTPAIRNTMDEFIKMTMHDHTEKLMEIVDEHSAGIVRLCEDTMDDVFLRELLHSRPFHSKPGEHLAAWNNAALKLNSERFPSGSSCKNRLKTLLRIARLPLHSSASSGDLTTKQLVRVRLVEAASSWHLFNSDRLLRDFSAVLARVDEVVEERFSANCPDLTAEPEDVDILEGDSIIVPGQLKPASQPACSQLPDVSTSPVPPLLRTETTLVVSRRQESVEAHSDSAEQISRQKSTLPAFVEQSSVGNVYRDDRMREERHSEIKAMIDMLKTERETHHRETTAMIALIQHDRADRREEFFAMIDLAKRAFASPSVK